MILDKLLMFSEQHSLRPQIPHQRPPM